MKAILNIESFNRGAIAIFNKEVNHCDVDVGYMPQQIGLDSSLTVFETINYFAILLRVDKMDCIKVIINPFYPCYISIYRQTEFQRPTVSYGS